jgi:hypothetical protein
VVGRLPNGLHMDSDPYEEFATQHGDIAGRTRGIRSGKSAQRKRQAYIRHHVAEGEDPEQVAVAHQGGQARPPYTPGSRILFHLMTRRRLCMRSLGGRF